MYVITLLLYVPGLHVGANLLHSICHNVSTTLFYRTSNWTVHNGGMNFISIARVNFDARFWIYFLKNIIALGPM